MSALVDVLRRSRQDVIAAWWQIIAQHPETPRPAEVDPPARLVAAFDVLLSVLDGGDYAPMTTFVEDGARRAAQSGVGIASAARALLAFKAACIATLRAQGWEARALVDAGGQIDEAVGWAVSHLAERYAERVGKLLAEQVERLRDNEARLLSQGEELGRQTVELARRVKEVDALNRSAAAVNASLELDRVLQAIAENAATLTETEYCVIYEWQAVESRMRCRTTVGVPREVARRIAAAVSHEPKEVSTVIQRLKPLAVHDLGTAESRLPADALAAATGFGLRASLAAPLVAHGRFLGYIATYYARPSQFGDHEVALLSAFAEHAAMALENAELYSQAKRLAAAEERNRIATEIHDTLAQGLSGLVLQIQGVSRMLERDPGLAQDELGEALRLARHTLMEARRSVWHLRAGPLEEKKLAEAIRAEARSLESAGLVVDFAASDAAAGAGPETEHNLLRIAQEALENVRRHARARRVAIRLTSSEEWLELMVADDGVGFDPGSLPDGHFGLLGMRDRARLLGGDVSVESTPGEGTRIVARLPANPQEGEGHGNQGFGRG